MKLLTIVGIILGVLTLAAVDVSAQGWATANPLYGTQTLVSGFQPDPVAVSVQAGGTDQPAAIGATTCTGMITAAQPDVRVNFTAGGLPLSFFVNSGADTTLIVNAPDGTWACNDDSNGLNPMVRFDAPTTGQYDVWVGVWNSSVVSPATLLVSELTPTMLTCEQNAQTLTGDPGMRYFVQCPSACTAGSVWGTGIYSDDSSVCTAAVHAGVVAPNQGGTFTATIAPGQAQYPPSTANGVTSSQWGSWGRSFTVAP